MQVSDLTAEHIGWIVRVPDPDPIIRQRTFVLGEIKPLPGGRVWLLDTDASGPGWSGTLREYTSETPVEVVGEAPKRRKRTRRA